MPPRVVTQAEMNLILTVADELGISREAIKVPLAPRGDGAVEYLAGGIYRVVVPASKPIADWLPELRAALAAGRP